MNKKARVILYFFWVFLLISIIYLTYSAFAIHTTSPVPGSFNLNQSQNYFFNITLNNTNAGSTGNITQINITLPPGFSFIKDSNGSSINSTGIYSSSIATFLNTSTVLSWTNTTNFLINGSINNSYFWFNATTTNIPGMYNITISSLNRSDVNSLYSTNISIIVNGPPNVTIITPVNGGNYSSSIILNASAISAVSTMNTLYFNITNSTGQVNFTKASNISIYFNYTLDISQYNDGFYNITVYANDTLNYLNNSQSVQIAIDNNGPIITLISPANGASSTTTDYNFTFNVTGPVVISNCSLIVDGVLYNSLSVIGNSSSVNGMYNSSFGVATHTWSINCTDFYNKNSNSSINSFIVSTSTQTVYDSGGVVLPFWTSTNTLTESQLKSGFTKELGVKARFSFKINNESHEAGIIDLTTATATINVSSIPQTAVLTIGEEKKFEINGDDYYDLFIKLNSIANSKANLTIKSIHEIIPVILNACGNSQIDANENCQNCPADAKCPSGSECKLGECINTKGEVVSAKPPFSKATLVLIIIVIIVILAILVLMFISNRKNK
jgi:hypothetical protein